jgi:hypothetical protein
VVETAIFCASQMKTTHIEIECHAIFTAFDGDIHFRADDCRNRAASRFIEGGGETPDH